MQELEKILDKIEAEHAYKVSGDRDTYSQYNEGWSDAIDRMRGVLENLGDGWIPVEKHLPEGRTRVICQFDNGDIELLWQDWESDPESLTYWTDFDFMAEKKVIAWRPLPEPYRPERSEGE